MPEFLFSVDPGAQAAFAFWRKDHELPLATFQVIPPTKLEWERRVRYVCDEMESAAGKVGIRWCTEKPVCYIEYPKLMPDGGSATARSGDLVKLCIACGQIARMFEAQLTTPVVWVPVAEWKGQMSKEAVKARIQRRLGERCPIYKPHEWDAVGIGLHVLGRF